MKRALVLAVMGLMLVGAETVPEAPKDAEQEKVIAALVEQLSAEDYATREAASRKLKDIGKPALPALQAASKSQDAEAAARAAVIIQRIVKRPVPGFDPNANANHTSTSMRMSVMNGVKSVTATENGRETTIAEDAEGIRMSVKGWIDGKEVTEEYKAKDKAALKVDEPEAYKLYEQYAGGGAGNVVVFGNMGQIQIQGGAIVVGPGGIAGNAGLKIRGSLGVTLEEKDGKLTVAKLEEGGRGEKLGLKEGDVVTQADGKDVKNEAELMRAAIRKREGLTLKVVREGKEVVLEEKPAGGLEKP